MDMIESMREAYFKELGTPPPQGAGDRAWRAVNEAHKLWLSENGMVIVPREPTEEMVLACVERGMPDVVTAEDSGPIVPALIWQAMIDVVLKRESGD